LPSAFAWCGAVLFVALELFINNGFFGISLEFVKSDFNLDENSVNLLALISFTTYAIFQIPAGVLLTKFGTKNVLTLASFALSIGIIMYANAQNFERLAIARVVIAASSSFAFIGCATVISQNFNKNYFAILFGFTQTIGNLTAVFANAYLPQIIEFCKSWQNSAILIGAVGIFISIFCFVAIKNKKQNYANNQKAPIQGLLKNKGYWLILTFASLTIGSFFNFASNFQISFQEEFSGNTLNSAATINSAMFLGFAIANPIFGYISTKIKSRKKPMLLSSIFSFAFILFAIFYHQISSQNAAIVYFLFGFSCAGAMLAYTMIIELISQSLSSIAIAICNMAVYLFGAFTTFIINKIVVYLSFTNNNPLISDKIAFSIFALCFLIAFVIGLQLKESFKEE
jgi:MFS family permease